MCVGSIDLPRCDFEHDAAGTATYAPSHRERADHALYGDLFVCLYLSIIRARRHLICSGGRAVRSRYEGGGYTVTRGPR